MNRFFSTYLTALLLIIAGNCWADGHPQHHVTLYYKVDCPYSQKVIRHLNKLGVAIPLRELNQDHSYREALKGMIGRSQVPCLVVDGEAIIESSDIIQWVDDHLIHAYID